MLLVLSQFWVVRPESEPSPQHRVQIALSGKLARLALYGTSLPADLRDRLGVLAQDMLPTETEAEAVVAARVILRAALESDKVALEMLRQVAGPNPGPSQVALIDFYEAGVIPDRSVLPDGLSDFFVEQTQQALPDSLQQQKVEKVEARLATLALLLAVNLLGGLVAILTAPWWTTRLATPAFEQGATDAPDFLSAAVAFLGWQLLVNLLLGPLLQGVLAEGFVTLLVSQALLYAAGLVVFLPLLRRGSSGFSRTGLRGLAVGLLGYWLCGPAVFLASLLSQWLSGEPPASDNPLLAMIPDLTLAQLTVFFLMVALIGPAFEEFVFRGMLHRGLRAHLRRWPGIACSAFIFAVMHGDPGGLLALFVLGGLFAYLYEIGGSLWSALVAHGLWNGGTLLLMILALS